MFYNIGKELCELVSRQRVAVGQPCLHPGLLVSSCSEMSTNCLFWQGNIYLKEDLAKLEEEEASDLKTPF